MNLYNNTKNQHFVSRAEQRLNTSTPNLQFDQMRIFAYDVLDRESYRLQLCDKRGFKISKNLSYDNMFTFSTLENSFQGNFEDLFQRYENRSISASKRVFTRLIHRMPPEERHIRDLLLGKMLNFIRNPFSIKKLINTFKPILEYKPTDSVALKAFNEVRDGDKPQRDHLCETYGIETSNYDQWIRVIFMLLYPTPGPDGMYNMYERMIEGFIRHETTKAVFTFGIYSAGHKVLLSDRGFSLIDKPGEEGFTMEFNVCSRCHFSFSVVDVLKHIEGTKFNNIQIASRLASEIMITPYFDNTSLLDGFNARTIYQAYRRVYCSSKIDPCDLPFDGMSHIADQN